MNRAELVKSGHAWSMLCFYSNLNKKKCYKFYLIFKNNKERSKRNDKISKLTATIGHIVPEYILLIFYYTIKYLKKETFILYLQYFLKFL